MAALAVGALVKSEAQLGSAAGGQQTEHPPNPCPQVELGQHGVGKGTEDAAQSVRDTRTVLCRGAEPVHDKEDVWIGSLVVAGLGDATQIDQIQRGLSRVQPSRRHMKITNGREQAGMAKQALHQG